MWDNKKLKIAFILFIIVFCLQNPYVCRAAATPQNSQIQSVDVVNFWAEGDSAAKTVVIGATDPKTEDTKTGFKFQLELDSKGASIRKATFAYNKSNRSGFSDCNTGNPQPLVIISPTARGTDSEILSMANSEFVFVDNKRQLSLQDLLWKFTGVQKNADGSQAAGFETTIKVADTNEPVVRLTKTYTMTQASYIIDCGITIENLSKSQQQIRFNLVGPGGIEMEGPRGDTRKVVACFKDAKGNPYSIRRDAKSLSKAKKLEDLQLNENEKNYDFLWAATVNKYFALILKPVPQEVNDSCNWVSDRTGWFIDPDGKFDSRDESIGLNLKIKSFTFAPAGQPEATKKYNFQLYIGPKDKSLFDKNELYRKSFFVETIDFMSCCCPASIINPLAFGILAIMKWMYSFISNYGIVIIILVFLMRLALHPITKKSSIAMNKMSKLAPRAEEIRKKYANDKTEMNKQMMLLYREQGASPIMGFLPMLVQMPIWIALWSAVDTSIDLRGASFLPFWITDLSAPDALIKWSTITIPWLGWHLSSLNLLPILMGVAFYLQQKYMPAQQTAPSNPQVAQQQKMMMIMMPIMFPLMLYNGPSGVNLYIMSSTFAGVIENNIIRKHIKEREEAEAQGLVSATSKTGGKVKKKKPKPFFRT
jgi:YidC/Oxa1 family membrane protein insertase